MRTIRPARTLLGAALVTGIALSTAAPALAIGSLQQGRVGVRETVCAQTLQFRSGPNSGANDGQLAYGQTFQVESRANGEVYGFAYGDINRNGYVQDGWFC